MDFVDREWELATFDRLWQHTAAQFLVLYGRRRIGKTRLLSHWLATRPARAIYWVAKPASSAALLRSFSQALARFERETDTVDAEFTYPSWEMAWNRVAELSAKERLVVVLDEFTYTLDATPDLAGTLQNAWDQTLSQRNLFLVLSGSHLGMMERELLAYRAPLYGRATARLRLQPLPFHALAQLFPSYDAVERVSLFATLGGIPAYLERFDPSLSLSANIKANLLTPLNLLQEEPRLLLQEQLSEPRNYMAIFEAIAQGQRTPSEIARSTGLASPHISKYLSVLRDLQLVHRDVPATLKHPERSRKGRWKITDPYLRFYYRFLASRQDDIALGRIQSVWRQIQKHMIDFIGANTFEELCRDWIRREGDAGRLPVEPQRVGSFWSKQAQADVVAIDWETKRLLLGECKWSRQPAGRAMIDALVEKAANVTPEGSWDLHFVFFARAGFTQPAREAAENHGMRLVDLEGLDAVLNQAPG